VAIASLTAGGRVEFANVLAGYDTLRSPVNANAQIWAVKVGGDWVASNTATQPCSSSEPDPANSLPIPEAAEIDSVEA
jgi:hypothetical protein